jgi:hypothetical protein
MSGDQLDPTAIYYSEAFTPWKYYPANNYLYVSTVCTGLAKISSGLLIFEKSKTRKWSFPPNTSAPLLLSSTVGLIFQSAITYVENSLVVFMSDLGVYSCDGSAPVCISDLINDELLKKNNKSAALVYDALYKRIYVVIA